ncbi:unnamed protein product [Schistocephalus solidus]|uniref:EGF-like domain-containing protein n=1 Tax=Schistocephalus solidus TaxID=70667 RepID=A0A183SUH4_SCHSO|nr:unnamed protein product [Schistocephalus solidus]
MSYLPSGSRFILLLFACVPTRPQFAKLHMLASINEEPYANLHRGYPMDALGRLFFSFSISEIKAGSWHEPYECGLNKDSWKWGSEACRRAYMSAVGTYIKYQDVPVDIYRRDENDAFSRYDRLQLRRTHVRLPLYNSEDLKGTPSSYWYKKNAFRLPGILSGQRVRGILEIMHKCGERIGRRNYPGGFLEIGCGFGEFLEIMYREGKTSMEHVIAPDSSLEALSAMFWFYFCKVAWPEAVKWNGSRALMYTHPVCPNPCAYLTNPCTRIDNVIRLSPSIVMDPDAAERKIYIESLKICQPTETGVYDHNYRCVCQNGYEWSSVTMRCLLIDGCKDPKTGQPMCSRKGTQRCISMSANLAREDLDVPTVALSLPYACICYPGYMGYRCESPRDACIEAGHIEFG